MERGILIGDAVMPGTEFVIRQPAAWWNDGERGTRLRGGVKADQLVGHWTAGHPRTGPLAGPKVVHAMKARKRPDGTALDVAIHFVISWDGLIWQTANLAIATTHVGSRRINSRSIGVECCWPGTIEQARKLGVEVDGVVIGEARGRRVRCLPPSPELVEAWGWLANAIVRIKHPAVAVPRQKGTMDRAGILEHCDVAGTTKVDAAGILRSIAGVR